MAEIEEKPIPGSKIDDLYWEIWRQFRCFIGVHTLLWMTTVSLIIILSFLRHR